MDEDEKLISALFPGMEDAKLKESYSKILTDMAEIRRQLWDLVLEHELADANSSDPRCLAQIIGQLDDMQRINLLLKVKVDQILNDNSGFLEMLLECLPADLLVDPSEELLDALQEEFIRTYIMDTTANIKSKSVALLTRMSGARSLFVISFLTILPLEKRSNLLYGFLLKVRRNKMNEDERAEAVRWRMTLLERAPKEVVSTFHSLLPAVKTALLHDAVLAVVEEENDKKILAMSKENGTADLEDLLLDEVMAKSDGMFISRVSSILIVSLMKMQSRKIATPMDQNTEDRDLLLSLLPDITEQEKKHIHTMTSAQLEKCIKEVYDLLVARVDYDPKAKKKFTSYSVEKQLTGIDTEKMFLKELAKREDLCRGVFGGIKLAIFKTRGSDEDLLHKYQEAKRASKCDEVRNRCAGCGTKKDRKELKQCSACFSVWYCSKTCQKADWKNHKKDCQTLKKAWVEASHPDTLRKRIDIPLFCLAVPPSLSGYSDEVHVLLPLWDLEDKKYCIEIKELMNSSQQQTVRNLQNFFKLERLGGETTTETVGNMCQDALFLYLGGYKDSEGNGVRKLSEMEMLNKEKKVTMFYQHYTPVPKGWHIPVQDRPFIPPDTLATLEEGIESVRKLMGERGAIY